MLTALNIQVAEHFSRKTHAKFYHIVVKLGLLRQEASPDWIKYHMLHYCGANTSSPHYLQCSAQAGTNKQLIVSLSPPTAQDS